MNSDEIKTRVNEVTERITQLTNELGELIKERIGLRSSCSHTTTRAVEGEAKCSICGMDLGWACPANPKGFCEYTTGDDDSCIHCGDPEERK